MGDSGFVALEGVDKTGKTVLQEILKTEIDDGEFVSDPTDIPPWDEIFPNGPHLHEFTNASDDGRIPGISQSFMFLTARLDCYETQIRPALDRCDLVVADRFSDSWLAYQSVYREQYFETEEDALAFFQTIHETCVSQGLLQDPDLTILITIDEERLKSRLRDTEDRTEYEKSPEKLMKVQQRYKDLKEENPDRFREVRDEGQGIIDIHSEIKAILSESGYI